MKTQAAHDVIIHSMLHSILFIFYLLAIVIPGGALFAKDGGPMKTVKLDFSDAWTIVQPSPDETSRLAAKELAEILEKMTGKKFPVADKAPGKASVFVLNHGTSAADGFVWKAAAGKVELRGDNARGLLYAVYDFLEGLGCRWVAPGKSGERIPRDASFNSAASSGVQKPSVAGRCLIIGHAAFLMDGADWIVWAGRNRLNTVFIHATPEKLATGAVPAKLWLRMRDGLLPLLRERGMIIEYGGHFMSSLLPRNLFKKYPEAFRYADGKRVNDHNFCPSSEKALSIVKENAGKFFADHTYVDIFHIWPDDILGGGWCSCDRCKNFTPSEQALIAVNAAADELHRINPKTQVSFLSYHDTEKVPGKVKPRKNICMLWAPRKRCYAHGTDDTACRVNVPHYSGGFRDQTAYFRKSGTAPARIFEYYLDEILFKSVLPPLSRVMRSDISFYNTSGAHTVQALLTGDRPFIAPKLNTWLFPRLCWNTEADTGALLTDFCANTFGTASAHLPEYFRLQERAFALALELSPKEALPERPPSLFGIFDDPETDVGDPYYAPPEVLREKARREQAVLGLIKEAEGHLNAAREGALAGAYDAEKRYFSLVQAWLRFDLARVSLYAAVAPGGNVKEGKRYLDDAEKALDDVYAWNRANISDPRFRKNFNLMRLYSWELRIDKIRADHYSPAWKRPFIKAKNFFRMVWLFIRLQGAFE